MWLKHRPVRCGLLCEPLAVSLAAWLQATLDVTEVLVFECLDQLEEIHQQVLEPEEEEEEEEMGVNVARQLGSTNNF